MNPEEQPNGPAARNTPLPPPPSYPSAEFYRGLAEQGVQQQLPTAQPYVTGAPTLPPIPRRQRIRAHNPFSRFVISWGGWKRLWLSLGSALASVLVYSFFLGGGRSVESWEFGLGFVALICVHELGHAFALRIKKLPATFPIFIPGVGAYVSLPNRPISLRDSADISLAGPFLGGVGALFCYVMFIVTYQDIWFNLARFGFLLNLLNLIPVMPLDGGHIGKTLSRWMGPLGLAILAILYFYTQNFFILFIGLIGLSDTLRAFNQTGRVIMMRAADRVIVGIMYGGLAALLFLGVYAVLDPRIYNYLHDLVMLF